MVPKELKELVSGQCLVSDGCGCKERVTTQSRAGHIFVALLRWFSVMLHLNIQLS